MVGVFFVGLVQEGILSRVWLSLALLLVVNGFFVRAGCPGILGTGWTAPFTLFCL